MSPGTSLDPTLHSHLVNRRRRAADDVSPLRSEEVTQVQHDALARVETYLDFLKRVGHRQLSQSIDHQRATILRGVASGLV
jgi:hypothetical protein